jgi:hypothetical protein
VFLPYTREVFDATQDWIDAGNLFPAASSPAIGYDDAAII